MDKGKVAGLEGRECSPARHTIHSREQAPKTSIPSIKKNLTRALSPLHHINGWGGAAGLLPLQA